MAPPKKRALPKPLPEGFILSDAEKKKWRLGKIIGQGGFGLIYLASRDVDRPVAADADFVIKLEYQENGPLFSELKFYQRAAKPESIQKWKRSRRLDFLGVPAYWASGLAEYNNLRYRFMAMDRLGSDLQKVCERSGGRMKKATVLQLGQGLVNVLEYIHENEYVHADIKAANLMLGYRDPQQVYLADYGLSYRYCPDGVHKEYKENPKKGHNGTIEYTSLDAHRGLAPSRRGDLQILGFCLLHWLCGSLPWDGVLKNPTQVQEAKTRLMDDLPGSVQQLSAGGASTDEVASFLLYVKTLGYQEKPDYQLLRAVLASAVAGRLDFSPPGGPAGESPAEVPGRDKKAAGRGSSKAKTVTTEEEQEEEEGMKSTPAQAPDRRRPPPVKPQTPQKAAAARGSSKPKSVPTEEEQSQPAQVPDRRRPPVTPQAPQKENGVSSAVRWSLRPRTGPAVSYKEDITDDEEEERTASRPISPRYLRGPPIGPRAQPKQNAKSERSGWETRGQQVGRSRTQLWTCRDHGDGPGGWAGRGLTGRDAAPRPGSRLFPCFFVAGAILFLAALLTLCG